MWNSLDNNTKSKSALLVHPFDHSRTGEGQPIDFENGHPEKEFGNFFLKWIDSVRGKCESPFKKGKTTYYKLFENIWCCDDFSEAKQYQKIGLGKGNISYKYNK